MSDLEDDARVTNDLLDDEEEDFDEPPKKDKRRAYADEEEDEEDEDEDEEDEEEDEDAGAARGKKRPRRHKRPAVNRFLDVEAEVDEDEEEEEEDEEYGKDGFIAGAEGEEDDTDVHRRAADHARLDRRREELNDQDLAQIAADVSERYRRTAVRYSGDMNEIPQRLLMPSVEDANLWQVRVKPGKERDLVFSLMRKSVDREFSNRPLNILSAFQRDSLPGMIYVEARSAKQVSDACAGLVGIYPSRGIILVPIEEMASLLQIKKQEITVTPGSWVRIKRPPRYQGDLAQVMDITENGEEVGLKFIPRIDLNPKDEATVDGKKRKKPSGQTSFSMRPPQRFFNYEEVVKVYGRKAVSKRNQVYVFQNDTYKDGFIEKDLRLTALQLENVNPTLDEITQFTRGQDGDGDVNVDLSIIAEASRKAAILVLQPGDHVEVFEGEQSGVHGSVHSIEQDIVTIQPVGVEFDGQRMQVPARSVRKRFKPGDHVKVMAGQNADETGLVVSVIDNVVTFLSDMSMQEVSVFSKDLREAAEVGTGTNTVGNFELHDLVQLDLQTVGVIFKTERDSFRVLDQNGQVRLVKPHQISMRRDSRRAIATDSDGHELRPGDNVKEIDGEGRKGRVLHTHQSFFAFLYNAESPENRGVFVTRARSLASQAPKGNLLNLGGTDLSKMNPLTAAPTGGMVGSAIGRGPRDRNIGETVCVVKGPQKGYVGIVKDTNGSLARVELLTGNKMISIDKSKIFRRLPTGDLEPLDTPRGGRGSFTRGGSGRGRGRGGQPFSSHGDMGPPPTAGFGGPPSRTPNPYNDGKTPGWTRTPNPYAGDGGKTPAAWSTAARTPNPYADGGKTPAWNTSSRTPNPYASGGGSTGGWGGATPGRPTSSWGGATPGRNNDSTWGSASRSWEGESSDNWDAAPTTAPTPAATSWSAPTPAAAAWSAPTPAAGVWSAPTPGVTGAWDARTPAFTPAGGFGAPTPAPNAAWGREGGFGQVEEEGPPEKWLLSRDLSDPKGIRVRIRSSSGSNWQHGNYDDQHGIILNVLNTFNESFDSTAQVKFLQPSDETTRESPSVPVQFLAPVEPDKVGEKVVIIHGNRSGQQGVVRDLEGDKVTISIDGTHVMDEIRRDFLAKIVPAED